MCPVQRLEGLVQAVPGDGRHDRHSGRVTDRADQGGEGQQGVEMVLLVDPVAGVGASGGGKDAPGLVVAHGLCRDTRGAGQVDRSHRCLVLRLARSITFTLCPNLPPAIQSYDSKA